MAEKTCTSCRKVVAGDSESASFACPNCEKEEIVRCGNCRKTSVNYKCACGFEGP